VQFRRFALLACAVALLAALSSSLFGQDCVAGPVTATPSTGPAPLTVSLNASPPASCDGYTVGFSSWDFGDGNTSSDSPQLDHVYQNAGTYTATAMYIANPNCYFNDPPCMLPSLGVQSSITVTALGSVTALALSPATESIMVGDENATVSLMDQNGKAVQGATWSVDNGTIVSLSTDDPPLLAGLTPGVATVTATLGSLSTRSVITVYPYGPGHRYPAGTVLWTLPSAPGSSVGQMLKTAPGSAADFIGMEMDASNTPMWARGMTASGQQLWQAPLLQYLVPPGNTYNHIYNRFCCLVADDSGGVLSAVSSLQVTPQYSYPFGSLIRIDGDSGALAWRYDQSATGSIDPEVATVAGSVWATEAMAVAGTQDSHSYLTQFDEQTGAVLQRTLLPTGSYNGNDTGALAGPISVLPDGSVAVGVATTQFVQCNYQTDALYLVIASPNGVVATTQLKTATGYYSGTGLCQISVDSYGPEEVIPDGSGGLLAAWTAFNAITLAASVHVSHADLAGVVTAEDSIATWPSVMHLTLGEGGVAFLTDSYRVFALDAAGAGVRFTSAWAPEGHFYQPVAALWGGGLALRDIDTNNYPQTQTIARLDASGNLTYDSFDATGLAPNTTWPTLGMWSGVNASGAYTQIAESEIVVADTPWAFPGGNPSWSRSPMMLTESMPFWGAMLDSKKVTIPDCALPVVDNGVTLKPAVLVSDQTVSANVKLQTKLQKFLNQIVTQNTINSTNCAKFFSKLKDPKAMTYYAALENDVKNQIWYNGHLSTITLYNAGAWETGTDPNVLAEMQIFPVSCMEQAAPTLFQKQQPNFKAPPHLGGIAQLQPPANSAYYNSANMDILTPSALVHEALHNVTGKNDISMRVFLGMKAPEDPNNPSTDDISVKLENAGCAPGR
jgi:hypothetical protein